MLSKFIEQDWLQLPSLKPSKLKASPLFGAMQLALEQGEVGMSKQQLMAALPELSEQDIAQALRDCLPAKSDQPALTENSKETSQETSKQANNLVCPETADWFVYDSAHELLFWNRWYYSLKSIKNFLFEEVKDLKFGVIPSASFPDHLSDEQKIACLKLQAPRSILSGGPGTGKSTVIRAAVELSNDKHIAICAPTNSAVQLLAQRFKDFPLKEGQELSFLNIHQLLKTNMLGQPSRNHRVQLHYDWIIMDESSMISSSMFAFLVQALNSKTRLSLIGDQNQLGAVDPGDCFYLLIEQANQLNWEHLCFLNENHRSTKAIQALTSSIWEKDSSSFFDLLQTPNEEYSWEIIDDTLDSESIAKKILLRWSEYSGKPASKYWDHSIENLPMILSSKRVGRLGSESLNQVLYQEYCRELGIEANPQSIGQTLGIPIINEVNDHRRGLTNGMTGVMIEHETVQFKDLAVPYASLKKNSLGWSMTVHKSQGKESDFVAVVLPTPTHSMHLPTRLLFTALTRSRKRLVILSSKETLDFYLAGNQ